MIGYEISFIKDNEYCDTEGPFFDKENLNVCLKNLEISWFKEGEVVEVSENEYWGDKDDYDFNDCFGRTILRSYQDLEHYFKG